MIPRYVFIAERFEDRIGLIADRLSGINLVYSMKANPFLLNCIPEKIDMIEVCSPGELAICKRKNIEGRRILYSGVVKGFDDSLEAIKLNVRFLTAESISQLHLLQKAAEKNSTPINVLLRLSSGNQFGMSKEDLFYILERQNEFPFAEIKGIHYFSGTSKRKIRSIEKDLDLLRDTLKEAEERFSFKAELVEYGPGLGVRYFEKSLEEAEEMEIAELEEAAAYLKSFAEEYPLSVEMGRFMAAPSGYYETEVVDVKTTDGTNYLMLDGGIHHLNYYGQNMAMKIPVIEKFSRRETTEKYNYCLCGSLCTTADVLVREVEMEKAEIGDILRFERSGAYSVTEAPALFLSRDLPEVYIEKNGKKSIVRESLHAYELNS